MTKFSLLFIRFYQKTLGRVFSVFTFCRFQPTCSHYGYEAIQTHGALKGWPMAIARILRCNPLSQAGSDPVPHYFSLRRNWSEILIAPNEEIK